MRDMVSLIVGCVEGRDSSARDEFALRFQRLIASTVIKTCGRYCIPQPVLIEDLIQDTYVRIFEGRCRVLRQLRDINELTIFGFVQSVAFSTVADHFRNRFALKRGGNRVAADFDTAIGTLSSGNPAADYEEKLLLQKIGSLLQEIAVPPNADRDRRIFELYLDGYSAKAIANMEDIGLTDKGVESVFHRLKAELRTRLLTQPENKEMAQRRGA
jgi:RNA polymerase sigma-70 factor, ECF subfamily